jgi:hypothetical protein
MQHMQNFHAVVMCPIEDEVVAVDNSTDTAGFVPGNE